MENKINIAEILKDYPKGTKLYSPLCGECRINSVEIRVPDKDTIIRVKFLTNEGIENYITFYYDGTYLGGKGECLLFPSKENRDWNTFKTKKPKLDPKTFQPFDKVIARNRRTKWKCGLFSHINDTKYPFNMECTGCCYTYCIPYNNETKYLIGTNDEAPEYYRYWEE